MAGPGVYSVGVSVMAVGCLVSGMVTRGFGFSG
jgi:hypothetical protein